MSSYLVMKRMRYQGVDYMPGTQLIDPADAVVLMQRGYLVLVPDNFTPPSPVSVSRASESAGSKVRHADSKLDSSESNAAAASGNDNNQTTDPLPTVDQALEAGYSLGVAEILTLGGWDETAENETKALEEVYDTRPEALALAKTLDSSLAEIMGLSNEDYEEAVKAFGAETPASTEA